LRLRTLRGVRGQFEDDGFVQIAELAIKLKALTAPAAVP
jgi:hypothetical protein